MTPRGASGTFRAARSKAKPKGPASSASRSSKTTGLTGGITTRTRPFSEQEINHSPKRSGPRTGSRNVYGIDKTGKLVGRLFLKAAIGAAYIPLAIGGDGRVCAQNDGTLFVVGAQNLPAPGGSPFGIQPSTAASPNRSTSAAKQSRAPAYALRASSG